MKKYVLLITLMCLGMFCNTCIAGEINDVPDCDRTILAYDDIIKVDVISKGQMISDNLKYDYSTSSKNEITYISNYINTIHLNDDGELIIIYDGTTCIVKFYMADDSIERFVFNAGRIYDISKDKQYDINVNEYLRFYDFINALKTKRLVLDDEVTFEPSGWAKKDIAKAVKKELVPKLNQINYKGEITRLETCLLIDNLLDKLNIEKTESTENPFSDTTDQSVIALYNYGIIDGKNENEFAPYDYITREELSKILSNTYYLINQEERSDDLTHEYADQEKISQWALNYVNDMYSLNIMIGNTENEFKPQDNVTKEELIMTLLRIYM